jgi:hypothetical protein
MRNLGKASLTGTVAFLLIGGGLAACEVSTTVIPLDGSVLPDASNDGTTNTDAPVTTNDGGTDADSASGYTPESLKTLLDKTLCDRVQVCCGNKGAGGAAFDRSKCAVNLGGGFENVTEDLAIPGVLASNITVDQARAAKCANDLQLLTCLNTTGAPSTEYKQAITDCYGALVGKVAANGACHGDVECVKGTYCEGAYTPGAPDVRTGTYNPAGGTCKALKALDEPCAATDKGWGDNCSNRGTGDTGNRCDLTAGKCAPLLAAGSGCQNNLACASSTCEYLDTNPPETPTTCGTKSFDPFICEGF